MVHSLLGYLRQSFHPIWLPVAMSLGYFLLLGVREFLWAQTFLGINQRPTSFGISSGKSMFHSWKGFFVLNVLWCISLLASMIHSCVKRKTIDFNILGAHRSFTLWAGNSLFFTAMSCLWGHYCLPLFLLLDLCLASRRPCSLLIMSMGFKVTIVCGSS